MKVSSSEGVHKMTKLVKHKTTERNDGTVFQTRSKCTHNHTDGMGSVPTCKARRRSSRYRWHDVGIFTHSPQPVTVSVVGTPCIRKLFSKSHQGCQDPQKGW